MLIIKPYLRHCVRNQITMCVKTLTTTEVATALRPFYFEVHPDLFGQYPMQRSTNENSLKQLSAIIETLQAKRVIQPVTLHFYVRNKTTKNEGTFRSIKISIRDRNLREIVLNVLKSCELSTDYIDKIPKPIEKKSNSIFKIMNDMTQSDPIFDAITVKRQIRKAKGELNLDTWLEQNYKDALEKTQANQPLMDELMKMRTEICKLWNLQDIRWDCGWNVTHFRGCLQSFVSIAEHHPEVMPAIEGRMVVFAPFTGISLDGHIMLNSGEVRHNWLDLLRNVNKYDKILFRIPGFEKSVSQVLRGIKVGRRKFMPKILAGEYERNLQQITTSLSDYHGSRGFPKEWPASLKDYEIVVETEAGPLMVSPTGQFIVPSSLPGFLLVNFITTNMKEARDKMIAYARDKHVEQSLHLECVSTLKLSALRKEDNVTPDLMIKCCSRILQQEQRLTPYLKGIHLNVSTYYSVLSDGVVCIPWDWKVT